MEASILSVVVVLIIVWYFGKSLNSIAEKVNSIVNGSAEAATAEFTGFKRSQSIRLHEQRIKDTEKVIGLGESSVLSDAEFDNIFKVIDPNKASKTDKI